jgi:hypothetical protein
MGKTTPPPQAQEVKQTTSNIPEYARPYFENVTNRAMAESYQPYTPYQAPRIAGFTPAQEQVQQNILGLSTPNQFGAGSALAYQAGLGALGQQYNPSQFNAQQVGAPNLQQFQMGPAMGVRAQQYDTPQMGTARTDFQPNLQAFQMGPAREVSSQQVGASEMQGAQTGYRPDLQTFQFDPTQQVSAQQVSASDMQGAQTGFGQQPLEQFRMAGPQMFGSEQAQQYMSPFIQQALEPQRREAITNARRAQVAQDLGSARQGTYGGSRQALASLERERNLGQQLGDIEARGMEAAFGQAQQQFERDRAAGMTTGQQNLEAALRQQQLGTQTGLQAALANLSNEQQARVNNQAQQFQAQGMNAEQAMRASLANQGVDVTRAQANLQSRMQTQELGAQQGLQAALANLSNEQQARVNNQAQQFQAQGMNAEQAMRASLANQGVDVTRAQADQQAALQTQQLGTQTGLQAALANLSSEQQSNVQNLAAQLQTQGMNSEQAMRAALANQQAGLTVGQANLQARLGTQQLGAQTGLQAALANQQQNLEAQRLGEQSRQFGAGQRLSGLQTAGQMGQTLGNLGQYQQQANLQRLGAQGAAAAEQRGLQQQYLDQGYADFLRQRDYQMERLGQFSNILRGLPVGLSSTQTSYATPPSFGSQALGAGLGGLSMARLMGGP